MTTTSVTISAQKSISLEMWKHIFNDVGAHVGLSFDDCDIIKCDEHHLFFSFVNGGSEYIEWAESFYKELFAIDKDISMYSLYDINYDGHGLWHNGNRHYEEFSEQKNFDFYEASNEDGYSALAIIPDQPSSPTSFLIAIDPKHTYNVAIIKQEAIEVFSPDFSSKNHGKLYYCAHPTEGSFIIMEHNQKYYSEDLEHGF